MKPTSFKETNLVLDPGNNENTDQLPIAICTHPDYSPGVAFFISKWKFSPEELARVMETGEIWVGVMCTRQPPIMPMAFNPFTEDKFKPIEL